MTRDEAVNLAKDLMVIIEYNAKCGRWGTAIAHVKCNRGRERVTWTINGNRSSKKDCLSNLSSYLETFSVEDIIPSKDILTANGAIWMAHFGT